MVPGRVCAIRKTEEAIRIAPDKIRQEAVRKGKQVQPQTLKFAQYVIVFTTFPEPAFPAAKVLEWYRLRWQVAMRWSLATEGKASQPAGGMLLK